MFSKSGHIYASKGNHSCLCYNYHIVQKFTFMEEKPVNVTNRQQFIILTLFPLLVMARLTHHEWIQMITVWNISNLTVELISNEYHPNPLPPVNLMHDTTLAASSQSTNNQQRSIKLVLNIKQFSASSE